MIKKTYVLKTIHINNEIIFEIELKFKYFFRFLVGLEKKV